MRRTISRLCLGLLIAGAGSAGVAAGSDAYWERAGPVGGTLGDQVAFDRIGDPWIVVNAKPQSRAFIARLTTSLRLADRRRLPIIPGLEVVGVDGMSVNARGAGALLLDYVPAGEESKLLSHTVAVAGWRPHHRVGHPIELASGFYLPSSMAIGASGTATVVWSENSSEVDTARVKSGRLLGTRAIAIPFEIAGAPTVLATPEGFLASWTLRKGFELVAVDNDLGSRAGVFGQPVLTVLHPHLPSPIGVSGAELASDARGDQVALWAAVVDTPVGRTEQLYVASRRAGERFLPAQHLGDASLGTAHLAIGPAGRIAVAWSPARGTVMAATGQAGRPLAAPLRVWPGGPTAVEAFPRVIITSSGQVIVVWAVRTTSPYPSIVAATSKHGRRFSRPQRISIEGPRIHACGEPDVLVADRSGGALAGWLCRYGRSGSIHEFARFRR